MKLLLKNPDSVVTCSASGKLFKRGDEMKDVGVVRDVDVLVDDGKISAIRKMDPPPGCDVIDISGKIITPGFVDPHTHILFAGTRENEYAMRSRGMSYGEIAEAGGGILNTVKATREIHKSKLRSLAVRRAEKMLNWGTTTLEVKSGYGLDFKSELKILEAANELREESIADIAITFLGAHAVPPEFKDDRDGYMNVLISDLIPYVGKRKLAEFCDVFCDEGFFDVDEAGEILSAGVKHGLRPKMHADELSSNGGVEVATELNAVSVDHLENISAEEVELLGESDTVGVILPPVAAYLRGDPAPAREMLDGNCVVAVGSDFNPGTSMVDNMQTVMWLAISLNRMTVEEALNAATINAAAAIGRSDRIGSIEVGKQADMLIVDARDYTYLPYHFTENRIHRVVKNGTVLEFS